MAFSPPSLRACLPSRVAANFRPRRGWAVKWSHWAASRQGRRPNPGSSAHFTVTWPKLQELKFKRYLPSHAQDHDLLLKRSPPRENTSRSSVAPSAAAHTLGRHSQAFTPEAARHLARDGWQAAGAIQPFSRVGLGGGAVLFENRLRIRHLTPISLNGSEQADAPPRVQNRLGLDGGSRWPGFGRLAGLQTYSAFAPWPLP